MKDDDDLTILPGARQRIRSSLETVTPPSPLADLRWRVLNERLRRAGLLTAYRPHAPLTMTIGQVVVLGLNQLEFAVSDPAGNNCAALGQALQKFEDVAPTPGPQCCPHFRARWHDAMCREMGEEEVEKFLLAWRTSDHGRTE